MKILIIVCLLMLAGCGLTTDPLECRESVREAFGPEAEVANMPGKSYHFIVRNKEGVWLVETMARGPEVSSKALIFGPKTK